MEQATCKHCDGLITRINGQWEHVSTMKLHLGVPPEPKPWPCCQGWGTHDITCAKYGQIKT